MEHRGHLTPAEGAEFNARLCGEYNSVEQRQLEGRSQSFPVRGAADRHDQLHQAPTTDCRMFLPALHASVTSSVGGQPGSATQTGPAGRDRLTDHAMRDRTAREQPSSRLGSGGGVSGRPARAVDSIVVESPLPGGVAELSAFCSPRPAMGPARGLVVAAIVGALVLGISSPPASGSGSRHAAEA